MIGNARQLVKQSHRATCGAFERELTVPTRLRGAAIRKLRSAGFRIIGTSYGEGNRTKIWFIKYGMAGL